MPAASSDARSTVPLGAWVAALVVVTGVLIAGLWVDLPTLVLRCFSVALAALFTVGLTRRLGGRLWPPLVLAVGFGAVAVGTRSDVLLAGAATAVAVLAATFALMITTPAARFRRAILEVLLAAVVATIGGLGSRGFATGLDERRFRYVVLGVTLLGAFVMVYRLGAGFHGLGRRGYALAAATTVLVALGIAYSAAFGRWGSPELVDHLNSLRDHIRAHLHAVPHPIETLLGIPALCWGVFMRARRRQGWWVCAFGAALTGPSTTRFIVTDVPPHTALLSIAYTLVLGLLLSYVLIRVDQIFTGNRGRGARRTEEADAHRPEPGRTEPLR